ncbi:MAG: hydroxymethylglutaryl-CoA reductase, degradative [Deltaproteobacteria bacterium]|nr:hydroxymethylglutaryl-CoA reductase, degradative [Deltaproteobacteria bacterium]
MSRKSRISGFFRLSTDDRIRKVAAYADLDTSAINDALGAGGLESAAADQLIENVIGTMALPFAVCTNFVIDGDELLVPMVIEEPSVVAAASKAALLARETGGFITEADPPITIAQIELLDVADMERAVAALAARREEWIKRANATQPVLCDLGGGVRDIQLRPAVGGNGAGRLVVHLLVDCRDAMGANMVNTMAESLAPEMAELCGGRAGLRILSNLADHRLVRATVKVPVAALAFGDYPGERVRDGIVAASQFAEADPYRATTHNKGILNGIDAVVLATGNDWRAVEAGAHAYADRGNGYQPLATWRMDCEGALRGRLEMPLVVGTVGGMTRSHPVARLAIELLGNPGGPRLARVAAAAGLANNLAALRALSTEGIQRGHMKLHERRLHQQAEEASGVRRIAG